uniref:Putative RNA-directed DNA polymerase n=1 Tax=Tanacetum cinerariifolium TaxID=118510 RepID=A0A699J3U2_TANCI|nr:putative RNA-directed DNA polymerase [Tanacetum cinerariifolium]
MNDINKEMSINYSQTNILWDRNEIGYIDEIFSYSVACDIMGGDDAPEPKSVIDCQNQPDWDKWKDTMQAELNSLNKRNVFRPIVTTPRDVKPVGCRWIFVQKKNEKNEVTSKGYKSNLICPCVFIKKTTSGLVIIAVYVDDLNIIGTNKEINKVVMHLNEEFEMKELDASYLSDPHKARSQTGYLFINGCTAISWRSQKQTLIATSSNHAEVITLHEASRECVWLRSMTQLIMTSCGLSIENSPTIIHEDNAACIAQMKEGYIKSDQPKHITPRYFAYTQNLIKDNQIEMKYVQSSNNSADLFTKALPTSVFKKHVHAIGMRHVQKTYTLQMSTSGGVNYTLHSFP